MRQQMVLVMDNLEAVLSAAEMTLTNVTMLSIFSTDVDQTMQNFDVLANRLGASGVKPPMTLVGVTRLALPGLMFELEAKAAD